MPGFRGEQASELPKEGKAMADRNTESQPGHGAEAQRVGDVAASKVSLGLRTRLTVVLPLVVGFAVLLSSYVVLWVCYPLLFEHTGFSTVQGVERRVMWVFTIGAAFALVGLVVAIAVAEWLARPLRSLVAGVESARRIAGEAPRKQDAGAGGDLDHRELRAAASSLAALLHDAYTLRSLEGGVVTLDQGGVVTSVNPVAERVLGCAASDAIGRPLAQLIAEEPANAAFLDSVRGALTGADHASSAEATVRTRDGREVRLGYTLTPLLNEARAKLGVVLTFKDLAERASAEQLMRQAESLALLGSMAFRLAQEIADPLTVMTGLVELIRDGSPPDSPHREYCKTILESLGRLRRISQELLTVGEPMPRALEPVDVNELVRTVVAACRQDPETRGTEIQEDYAPDLPSVPGHRAHLAEVVRNILRNACQAVRAGGGLVRVSTALAPAHVNIILHNTGPAIPPEVQQKLFTTFFPPRQRGAGLGLAMSQQLVKAHGGQILVDSAPERGTTFTVQLPLSGPSPGGTLG